MLTSLGFFVVNWDRITTCLLLFQKTTKFWICPVSKAFGGGKSRLEMLLKGQRNIGQMVGTNNVLKPPGLSGSFKLEIFMAEG